MDDFYLSSNISICKKNKNERVVSILSVKIVDKLYAFE